MSFLPGNSCSLLRIVRSKKRKLLINQTCSFLSSFSRISLLSKESSEVEDVTVKGWVKAVRKFKDNIFVDVDDGSCSRLLQVVVPKSSLEKPISYGSSVVASGNLVKNPHNQLELVAKNLEVIGECNLEGYPFRPKKNFSNDYVRQYLHLRFRTSGFSALLRIRNEAVIGLNDFFRKEGFLNIHTPILTSNDCEGAGEVFTVLPDSEGVTTSKKSHKRKDNVSFFDHKTYLTVSGQLHLEAAARAIGNVYTFGPTFRAENSKSRLHLSEFYMAEAEMAFISSVEDITSLSERLIKHMIETIMNKCAEDVDICRKTWGDPADESNVLLENFLSSNFTLMSYKEASEILSKNKDKINVPHSLGNSFSKEHELFLVKHNSNKPVFVIDWPTSLKPFYMKQDTNDQNTVFSFDLLCNTVGELCGGSLRENDYNKLQQALALHGLTEKLKWYLELRKYGNIMTGGFGMGFERFLQAFLNIGNIKDTLPFPRWPHNCDM